MYDKSKIKEIRKLKGLSQKEMAVKLNVSISSYQKIEQGIMTLSLDRFLDICRILNIDSYNTLLPAVNADIVEQVEKVLTGGALAFGNIHSNCNYSRKLIDELIEKIKSGTIENRSLKDQLELIYQFLNIIGKESSNYEYQFRSIQELIEKID